MNLDQIISDMEKNVQKNNTHDAGDYINPEDGLLYCCKCHTKKQCKINIFGSDRIVPCICECKAEELKAEEERERKQREYIERQKKIAEYRRTGIPDEELKNCTFENDDLANPTISAAMRKYVEDFEYMYENGKGLLLFGETGTGKTYLAASIVNALIDKGYPCLMTKFSRIEKTLFQTADKQDYLDSLNQFALLAIDDLNTERGTDYMKEIVYDVIDSRERAGLPLIITTNLTREELQKPSDMAYKRIYSRLYKACTFIEVEGADRRRQQLIDETAEMRKRLGL